MRWLAAFLALGAITGAAQARSPEALACAIKAAPPELDARLADVVLAADPDKDKPATDALQALVDACATDQFLNDKERAAYFEYTMGRMARDALDGRLAEERISSGLIDRALDIGPGNVNNPAEEVTAGDLRRVSAALAEAGTDPVKVTPVGWGLINAWIVATAQMMTGQRAFD